MFELDVTKKPRDRRRRPPQALRNITSWSTTPATALRTARRTLRGAVSKHNAAPMFSASTNGLRHVLPVNAQAAHLEP